MYCLRMKKTVFMVSLDYYNATPTKKSQVIRLEIFYIHIAITLLASVVHPNTHHQHPFPMFQNRTTNLLGVC